MLGDQHACGELRGRIVLIDGDACLSDNRPAIDAIIDFMDGAAGIGFIGGKNAMMRVETAIGWQ